VRINPGSALLPEVRRGAPVALTVNGKPVKAFTGETIASVLLSEGIFTFHRSPKAGEPRGIYCGMGVCFECLVTVNGVHAVQACLTPVAEGMQIETGKEPDL
jgi:sarcosine oxidase subunit alpha